MDEENDPERNEIREKLSKMTFEEILKLKEKLGTKLYNEATLGKSKVIPKEFKRDNKNRPREVSSKKSALPKPKKIKPKVDLEIRDPRFDSLCGDFDDRRFRKSYGFLDDIRKKEKLALIKQLKVEKDPDQRKLIKASVQRLKNIEKEGEKKALKDVKAFAEREERIALLKQGKKPHFKSKLETKVERLVEQYDELKKKSKVQKHIEKQRKRIGQREKKKGYLDD